MVEPSTISATPAAFCGLTGFVVGLALPMFVRGERSDLEPGAFGTDLRVVFCFLPLFEIQRDLGVPPSLRSLLNASN